MRTTIRIDDDVFRAYKLRAADRGTSFAREVEDALRAGLAQQHSDDGGADQEPPFTMTVVHGEKVPGVDVNTSAFVWDESMSKRP